MTLRRPDGLRITADLRLDVDDVRAQVVGDGNHVTVSTDDVSALAAAVMSAGPWSSTTATSARARLADLAGLAQDLDLTVTVAGRRGPVVRVGAGARPAWTSRVLGSSNVEILDVRSAARAAAGTVLRPKRAGGWALAAAGIVTAVLVRRLLR